MCVWLKFDELVVCNFSFVEVCQVFQVNNVFVVVGFIKGLMMSMSFIVNIDFKNVD